MSILINGVEIATDKEGFLTDLNTWSAEVATALAAAEGIELSDEHWQILELLRQFQREFDISPPMRPLVKYVSQQLGANQGNSVYLTKLFPPNPAKIASKIAGLPKPEGCL